MRREEVMIEMRHARMLGFCARGVRMWCQRHGIEYSRLLAGQVSAAEALATGDDMGRMVAEMAIQMAEEAQ